MKKKWIGTLLLAALLAVNLTAQAELSTVIGAPMPYVDYSSDRSAVFFNTNGYNENVFLDFFYPFDAPMTIDYNDPLINYPLEHANYDKGGVLMVSVEELAKLYGPWFDVALNGDAMTIRHITYTKNVVSGHGGRAPVMDYQKTVYLATYHLGDTQLEVEVTPYEPIQMETNKNIEALDAPDASTLETSHQSYALDCAIEEKDGIYYVPAASFLTAFGKEAVKEDGYLTIRSYVPHIRSSSTKFTTQGTNESVYGETYLASVENPLQSQRLQGYTWGRYMNGVLDGSINKGFLWRAFYAGNEMLYTGEMSENEDAIGEGDPQEEVKVNRIIPYALYIPQGYDGTPTQFEFCLHGGTGNENAAVERLSSRKINICDVADEYNTIVLFPNGYTRGPAWSKGGARFSFFKAYDDAVEAFGLNVDKDKVFLWGNSAGGNGTLDLSIRYPEMFKAISVQAPAAFNDKRYDRITDMPMFGLGGTADVTLPFDTIFTNWHRTADATMKNDLYMAVEQGQHSYAYGSGLRAMEDFFQTVMHPEDYARTYAFEVLRLSDDPASVMLDDQSYPLEHPVKVVNGQVMLSLNDIQTIYGKDFWRYDITAYDEDPAQAVSAITLRYGLQTLNLRLDSTWVRMNAELYAEDFYTKTDSPLQPDVTRVLKSAPFEEHGIVYVPVQDIMSLFGEKVEQP